MGFRAGQDWGQAATVPPTAVCVRGDRELAGVHGVAVLQGGNIHEALGRPELKVPGQACTIVPVDAMDIEVEAPDGSVTVTRAASDVTVGSWWSRRGFFVVTNAGHVAGRNLTPRAHPGDGRLDFLRVDPAMDVRARMIAARRARTGTHLPHPGLHVGTLTTVSLDREGRAVLRVDGHRVRSWRRVTVTVVPGCLSVVV